MNTVMKQNLLDRLQNYPHANYNTVFSVMKGVALANAAVVMTTILKSSNSTSLLFWLASFFAVILTNQAAMFGIIFIAWHRFRFVETFLSFLLGILEFGLFGLSVHTELGPWLLCFAAFSAVGGMLAYNAFRMAKPANYESDLDTPIREYRASQRSVTKIAGSSTVVWVVLAVVFWDESSKSVFGYLCGVVAVLNMVGALHHQSRYTRSLSDFLLGEKSNGKSADRTPAGIVPPT